MNKALFATFCSKPVEKSDVSMYSKASSERGGSYVHKFLRKIHDDDLLNVHALAGISIYFLLYPFIIASKVLHGDIVRIYFEFIKTGEIS